MNYKRHYEQLILKHGTSYKPEGYSERHHILPRCLGGNDDAGNLVYLSARCHYLAHLLLYQIYREDKLVYALARMQGQSDGTLRRIPSHLVAIAKKAFIAKHPMKNPVNVAKMLNSRDYQSADYLSKLKESHNTEQIKEFRREFTTNNNPMSKPENVEKMRQSLLDSPFTGKEYIISLPDGSCQIIRNLRRFCKEINLPERSFWRTLETERPNRHGYQIFNIQ